jgi:transposase
VNWLVDAAPASRVKAVITPKRKGKVARTYETELYKERHLIEYVFRWLNQWRGIATRYAQRSGILSEILRGLIRGRGLTYPAFEV